MHYIEFYRDSCQLYCQRMIIVIIVMVFMCGRLYFWNHLSVYNVYDKCIFWSSQFSIFLRDDDIKRIIKLCRHIKARTMMWTKNRSFRMAPNILWQRHVNLLCRCGWCVDKSYYPLWFDSIFFKLFSSMDKGQNHFD